MEKSQIEITQLRIPTNQFEYIQSESDRTGISQNGIILMLIELGKKVYEGKCTIQISDQ